MANFAKLDDANIVIEIVCIANEELLDENGQEVEAKGIEFLVAWSNGYQNWKQTSYNNSFRKNYAVIGGAYDATRNAFIHPKPFTSWVLDDVTCQWIPPIPYPEGKLAYEWDEQTISWKLASLTMTSLPIVEDSGRVVGDLPATTVGDSNA